MDTGVKHGCILSPVPFSMAVDWLMRSVTQGRCPDIHWALMKVLEDLHYAGDISPLSSNHLDAQQKVEHLSKPANSIGLKVNTKKTQVLRKNTRVNDPVMIDKKHLEDIEEFTYLGTNVTTTCDCDQEVNTRISEANHAFAMLKPVWKITKFCVHT